MPIDPKDFTASWEPALPSGAQWVAVTHTPTGRTFRLKAAKCVRLQWAAAPDPAAARKAWLVATGVAYLERLLYDESDDGVREAAIQAVKDAARAALAARETCEALKLKYPAYAARIPTITVELGDD